MHAEYVALSTAMRELIPLKEIVVDIAKHLGLQKKLEIRTKSTIFEDNQGCERLAKQPHMTPQSKFFAIKLHWFRQHTVGPDRTCDVVRCESKEMIADIFTKGLDRVTFEYLRKKLMGW